MKYIYPAVKKNNYYLIFIAGFLTLIVSFLISMSIGPSDTTVFELIRNWNFSDLILRLRFPRILLGIAVGASLSSTGAAYQSLLQNPLADPYLLGVSGGAALGTAIAVGLNLPTPFIPIVSFLFSFLAMLFVFIASKKQGVRGLLLTGVVFNAFSFALVLFLNAIFSQRQAYEMLFFLIGSLDFSPFYGAVSCIIFSAIGVLILTIIGRALNITSFGHEHAKALGVSTNILKIIIFATSAMMIGSAVAFSGMIGFVGLFVPHAIRLAFTSDNRILIPASALFGGSFLILADSLARSSVAYNYFGGEIPVGVITALIGAPIFFWLLKK